MTDLERFVELYKSFGIECTPIECKAGIFVRFLAEERDSENIPKTNGEGCLTIWFTHSGIFSEQQIARGC